MRINDDYTIRWDGPGLAIVPIESLSWSIILLTIIYYHIGL